MVLRTDDFDGHPFRISAPIHVQTTIVYIMSFEKVLYSFLPENEGKLITLLTNEIFAEMILPSFHELCIKPG